MGPLVPDPVASDEQRARYFGEDLATLAPIEVRVEVRRIELALATTHRHQHVVEAAWLRQRHARLRRVAA
jgi:hypothetical protein